MKFSVCQPDFSASMQTIGQTLAGKPGNLCVDGKLVDVDVVAPGIQPDCRVAYMAPTISGSGAVSYLETQALPQCASNATSATIAMDCWVMSADTDRCPFLAGQRIDVLRTPQEIAAGPLPEGTKIKAECRTCPQMASGVAVPGCDY